MSETYNITLEKISTEKIKKLLDEKNMMLEIERFKEQMLCANTKKQIDINIKKIDQRIFYTKNKNVIRELQRIKLVLMQKKRRKI